MGCRARRSGDGGAWRLGAVVAHGVGGRPVPESAAEALSQVLAYSPIRPQVERNRAVAVRELLGRLGNPERQVPVVVHVAGTSGKTSVAYAVRDIVLRHGVLAGLSVSPHVVDVRERAQVGDGLLPEREYCLALADFLAEVDETGLQPSFYALMVVFALWLFARQGVQVAVLEVGAGGRFDVSNVFDRRDKIGVISTLGMDHVHMLGPTVYDIAWHKAGITRPGNTVFVAEQTDATVTEHASRCVRESGGLPVVVPGTCGADYRQSNIRLASAVAQQALTQLGKDCDPRHAAGVGAAPGRLEVLTCGRDMVLLDGAHNPQKLQALAGQLRRGPWWGVPVVCAAVDTSPGRALEVAAQIASWAAPVVATGFVVGEGEKQKRAMRPADFVAAIHTAHSQVAAVVVADPRAAVAAALAQGHGRAVVTGSLYLVSVVRGLLLRDGFTPTASTALSE